MFFRACSVKVFDFRRSRAAVLAGTLVSDDASVGRSAPLHPLGRRGARGFTPSRALPRAVRSERLVSDGTGGQRVWDSGAHTFAAGQTKLWFLTEQAGGAFGTAAHVLPRLFGRRFRPPTKPCGCSGGNFGFRRRGRGALRSPTPPRGRGARGFTPSRALPGLFGRKFWFPAGQAGGAYLPRLFERCFGFRENARGVPLGTEAGESHIFTSRFRRSFSFWRNAFTALFRRTGCERSSHPVAPKNGEFMKLID